MLLCSQRGGDTKKFFEKAIVFGVFHRSCQNAKNYQLFEKIFRVPPVANTVTLKCPPPVACPVRHLTTHVVVGLHGALGNALEHQNLSQKSLKICTNSLLVSKPKLETVREVACILVLFAILS